MSAHTTTSTPSVEQIAQRLVAALRAVLGSMPNAPLSPTALAHRIGVSRVTLSKLQGALAQHSPLEVLQRIPGPESLREVVTRCAPYEVDPALITEGMQAIDGFDRLIRNYYGTRAALHAAIGSGSTPLRARIDHAARADVFKGLSQILGVECNTWLTSMFFVPSKVEASAVEVTTIHGALGLRRLRNDTTTYFTFGAPYPEPGTKANPKQSAISLHECYTNAPAQLEVEMVGGQLRHKLVESRVDKDAIFDMLAVSHNPMGSRRYATPEGNLRGVSAFVDTPARMFVCDAIMHKDVYPSSEPTLVVYNTASRGPANPNDRNRDLDRLSVAESVVQLGASVDRFDVPEVPNYARMVERVCGQLGVPSSDFRVYRLRFAYPVPAFQFVVAFEAPQA
jgi:hypothetical protein